MKKLSKVTTKLNNALLEILSALSSQLSTEANGFIKLDHEVKFDNFPGSIFVSCYFQNEQCLTEAKALEKDYQKQLKKLLLKKGILLKTVNHLQFIITPDIDD